jgi:hypothetical protein
VDFSFLDKYRDLAVNTYHVDPVIFIVIYVISIPFCYICLFVMGKLIWHLKETHKLKGREIIKHKNFVRALIVYLLAFISPYFYVLVWGDNLPIWVWLLISLIVGLSLYIFVLKIKKQTS